ncbi:transketolase [Wickerhamomyces ciferrii]|uniref:transketolase n=1 Tax=Wickerhamomyces ciferrii (strain ATCC 14091 / BCRC 22168 / CBS 111 / JCM 3599 / NBRC 0793 / NRRL Y-1031 F-60-10) TaxID=1206466 RepID=K0KVD3_WICCF|nr:transketolase [Wickerhamomyces ciferrii]CCH45867.1 transketolase [Wickerhamomyces ciferrii]
MSSQIEQLAINTIKLLSVDQVSKANSGHPGAPLGLAPLAHIIWKNLKFNPKNPEWINKDRFVLSNGHSVALLYSLLHLFGYDLSIDDLKNFRQLGSKTPGHPESETPGIEVTTGPLGQGISNAVGLAIAEKNFAARYNKPDFTISDSRVYTILGDGCLQEGVSSEASSLAGHLKLNNLIAFYDDNHITIDGDTNVSFTEDVNKRYEAYGWNVIWVKDGNNDLEGIAKALEDAKKSDKPTLIRVTTVIGYGSLQAGTHSVHGSPLKADDVKQLKEKLGFNPDESFVVPQEVYDYYNKEVVERNQKIEEEWNKTVEAYKSKYPELGAELSRRLSQKLPENWAEKLPTYNSGDKALATRKLSEMLLDSVFDELPELIGGSADLTGSNLTRTKEAVDFQPDGSNIGTYAGRYIRYGVREHGMGAIMNGIAAFGANYKPYGGTFLNFVSYAAGAVRLSALSGHPVIWVATHDSIGLGEDGPTHQPIETLAHFRATPNLKVWRPADGNEVSAAYQIALEQNHTPSIIALSRQNLPQLEGSSIEKASKGGYVVHEVADAHVVIVSTGSEVSIAIDASKKLKESGINARVVSLPDFHTFDRQPKEYQLSVLPDGIPILSVEVLSTSGWAKYAHEQFGIDRFGASGKAPDVYKFFEFTPEGIASRAIKTIDFYKGSKIVSPLNRAFYPIHYE